MQISFIGAGKVGVSLGKYFISKGRKVGGYYSLSPKSAAWAANFTNTKQYQSIEEIISSSDMIFFTVPDDKIGEVWEVAKPYAHGKIIAHCSGIHSSNIFSDIDRTGRDEPGAYRVLLCRDAVRTGDAKQGRVGAGSGADRVGR